MMNKYRINRLLSWRRLSLLSLAIVILIASGYSQRKRASAGGGGGNSGDTGEFLEEITILQKPKGYGLGGNNWVDGSKLGDITREHILDEFTGKPLTTVSSTQRYYGNLLLFDSKSELGSIWQQRFYSGLTSMITLNVANGQHVYDFTAGDRIPISFSDIAMEDLFDGVRLYYQNNRPKFLGKKFKTELFYGLSSITADRYANGGFVAKLRRGAFFDNLENRAFQAEYGLSVFFEGLKLPFGGLNISANYRRQLSSTASSTGGLFKSTIEKDKGIFLYMRMKNDSRESLRYGGIIRVMSRNQGDTGSANNLFIIDGSGSETIPRGDSSVTHGVLLEKGLFLTNDYLIFRFDNTYPNNASFSYEDDKNDFYRVQVSLDNVNWKSMSVSGSIANGDPSIAMWYSNQNIYFTNVNLDNGMALVGSTSVTWQFPEIVQAFPSPVFTKDELSKAPYDLHAFGYVFEGDIEIKKKKWFNYSFEQHHSLGKTIDWTETNDLPINTVKGHGLRASIWNDSIESSFPALKRYKVKIGLKYQYHYLSGNYNTSAFLVDDDNNNQLVDSPQDSGLSFSIDKNVDNTPDYADPFLWHDTKNIYFFPFGDDNNDLIADVVEDDDAVDFGVEEATDGHLALFTFKNSFARFKYKYIYFQDQIHEESSQNDHIFHLDLWLPRSKNRRFSINNRFEFKLVKDTFRENNLKGLNGIDDDNNGIIDDADELNTAYSNTFDFSDAMRIINQINGKVDFLMGKKNMDAYGLAGVQIDHLENHKGDGYLNYGVYVNFVSKLLFFKRFLEQDIKATMEAIEVRPKDISSFNPYSHARLGVLAAYHFNFVPKKVRMTLGYGALYYNNAFDSSIELLRQSLIWVINMNGPGSRDRSSHAQVKIRYEKLKYINDSERNRDLLAVYAGLHKAF